MTIKERLIKELEEIPDTIAEEMLNFCLFLKHKNQTQTKEQEKSDLLNFLHDVEIISQEIPAEEWEKLPVDLSKNLDYYLYGTQKNYRSTCLRSPF
ncbi:hypothetical protein [Spirulina sp. 06S082]|uniref:hypothetical protein n=1 Tax=Spirulina sp. 06S082 TaxID=3110248 RepID=UPI002B1FD155|nr:hypothetical protein [Spirulina sp. 06S082]MEA5468093.1 hypothetical protein [Spirulina sp. 06S082]